MLLLLNTVPFEIPLTKKLNWTKRRKEKKNEQIIWMDVWAISHVGHILIVYIYIAKYNLKTASASQKMMISESIVLLIRKQTSCTCSLYYKSSCSSHLYICIQYTHTYIHVQTENIALVLIFWCIFILFIFARFLSFLPNASTSLMNSFQSECIYRYFVQRWRKFM